MKRTFFPVFLGTVFAAALAAPASWAVNLKQVQVADGSQIDLLFDGKVSPRQIRTDFFNDVIQVTLTHASVYPAKISSVDGGAVTKIFAYQYAPRVVRCRFTVKGKAEDYRNLIKISPRGSRILSVNFASKAPAARAETAAVQDQIVTHAAQAVPANGAKMDLDEQSLLQRVLKGPDAKKPSPSKAKAPEQNTLLHNAGDSANAPLALGKPLPSPMGALGKLAVVLALFGAFAWALKRLRSGSFRGKNKQVNAVAQKGMLGAIKRFANGSLGGRGKMIEIVSTHYLGPKKSIAVARIAGRMLVLGVSNESINLITQLPDGEETSEGVAFGESAETAGGDLFEELAREPSAPKADFSKLLTAESAKPQKSLAGIAAANAYGARGATPAAKRAPGNAPASTGRITGVRAQIRSRLEGLKQL